MASVLPERLGLVQTLDVYALEDDRPFQVQVPDLVSAVEEYKVLTAEEQGHSSQMAFYQMLGITVLEPGLTTEGVAARYKALATVDRELGRQAFQHLKRNYGCIRLTDWLMAGVLSVYGPVPSGPGSISVVSTSMDVGNQLEALRVQGIARQEQAFLNNLLHFIGAAGVFSLLKEDAGPPQPDDRKSVPRLIGPRDERVEEGRQLFYLDDLRCRGPFEPPPGEFARRGYVTYEWEDPVHGIIVLFFDCKVVRNAAFAILKRAHRGVAEMPDWQSKAGMKRRALRRLIEGDLAQRGAALARFAHLADGSWRQAIREFLAVLPAHLRRLGLLPQ